MITLYTDNIDYKIPIKECGPFTLYGVQFTRPMFSVDTGYLTTLDGSLNLGKAIKGQSQCYDSNGILLNRENWKWSLQYPEYIWYDHNNKFTYKDYQIIKYERLNLEEKNGDK